MRSDSRLVRAIVVIIVIMISLGLVLSTFNFPV
jgi:hypothetical protein